MKEKGKSILLYILACLLMLICVACGSKSKETGQPENNGQMEETGQSDKEGTASRDATEWSRKSNLSNDERAAYIASLKASENLAAQTLEKFMKITCPSDMTAGQGGYTNGKYFFQGFVQSDTASDEANNVDCVARIDMETGEVELESERLQLNHCNDITYNEKLGYLVVVHNNPNRNCISFIEPENLTYVKTIALDYYIWSIDYNPTTDKYVVGLSGGQTFRILDSEFHAVGEVFTPNKVTKSSTTQGVASDDDFIYFVYYNPNIIGIYDWDGNFVTTITLDKIAVGLYEPENISVIGDTIYIGCYNKASGNTDVFTLKDFVPYTETADK